MKVIIKFIMYLDLLSFLENIYIYIYIKIEYQFRMIDVE